MPNVCLAKFQLKTVLVIVLMFVSLTVLGKSKVPHFSDNFKLLENNLMLYRSYDDSVHGNMDDAAWVAMMERRARCYQKMYVVNNRLIDQITNYFHQSPTKIPEAAYDSLLTYVKKAFQQDKLDNFLVDHFASLLRPHYEAKCDTNQLVLLNLIQGVCNTEISRFLDDGAGELAKKYLSQNMRFGDYYSSLSPMASGIIIPSYMNYCYALSSLGFVSASEAWEAMTHFESFLNANESKLAEANRIRGHRFLDRIKRTAARIHQTFALKNHADSVALEKMYLTSPFAKMKLSDATNAEDSVNFVYTQYKLKKVNVQEADSLIEKLTQTLFDSTARLDTITEFHIQTLSNVLTANIDVMDDNPQVLFPTRVDRVTYLCRHLVDFVQRTHITRDPFFFESMLGKLACMKPIFAYLPTDEKMSFMTELAVKAQIGTIAHVNTVDHLALVVFESMMRHCPEQFLGVMGLNSVEALRANQAILTKWIGTAAGYHDLGKIGISAIINNSFRHLTDREFAISRNHPELALRYFAVDTLFQQFQDIALGHHKWYNGKGGYPASFDNTKSPYKGFIDLVTICDCIDAATDFLGRNYRKEKKLDQVLVELKHGAGKLYNPVMVNALIHDQELCQKIDDIITDYRFKQLKEVRDRYMK